MYFKNVCLYKRRQHIRNSKRRVTLNHFDAIFRCNALIVKMARIRFPGRPGQRIGKNYVKYAYDDVKMNMDACLQGHNKIEVGLKLFYELFGFSDEEEEFDGFSPEDLVQAEAVVTLKLKQKQAISRYLESNRELSSSAASEIDKIISSDSDTSSSSSTRQKRGMRDIIRKSYDKMVKGEVNEQKVPSNSICCEQSKPCTKQLKCNVRKNIQPVKHENTKLESSVMKERCVIENNCKVGSNSKIDLDTHTNPGPLQKKSLLRHLLEKTKQQVKTRRKRRRSMRPNVKKKFRKRLIYPSRNKYAANLKKNVMSDLCTPSQIKLRHKSWPEKNKTLVEPKKNSTNTTVQMHKVSKVSTNVKSKHSLAVGRKRFVLPSMSARSSRKIIPRRRYLDEYDQPNIQAHDEESQCSRSSLSGSSETISAMDGGSSPDDSQVAEDRQIRNPKKKIGILDRPLVVEGKRPWKPSLKVQMKLSEMKFDYPFALKKNMDGSSGTSSGSFKDIIKPDMVSKYAEKMAQKPKEKPIKLVENVKKNVTLNAKVETENVECDNADLLDDPKKPEDKLEKVAAKIEKLLKSQWEGRLKDSKVRPSVKMPSKLESAVVQWKTEQQQRTCSQRRTKNILRKARLQLKKRNLNLRTRQSDKQAASVNVSENEVSKIQSSPKKAQSILPSLSVSEQLDVPSTNISCTSVGTDCASVVVGCAVCGFSKICLQTEKLYDQMACEPCNRFFEGFAKTPKQYFCIKDGKCIIDSSKDTVVRRVASARCKACWLKICMEKLTVSSLLRDQLIKYVPRLDVPPHNPLLTVDNVVDFPVGCKEEGKSKGPRIKHVCRRAAVVLGLPRATFSDLGDSKEPFFLSALPEEEKQKILETAPPDGKQKNTETAIEVKATAGTSKSVKQPLKKKVHKDIKVKNRVHLDLLKKSSLLIHKEQKRRKLLLKKSIKHLRKHSFKKSLKVARKSEMKKTLKFSYKSAVKTVKTTPKIMNKGPAKCRKVRCKQCKGCLADDCGKCIYCLDKKKFGGPNLIKQACMFRRCLRPVLPASERKVTKTPQAENIDKDKPSGGHSSFGGDGPSGIGTSLTSSSSSPSSPDGSSCGSSCSSSSTTSSSGSSGSSSSSSSGSSSSTSSSSSSDNVTVPHGDVVGDTCGAVSLVHSIGSEPVILQESECVDTNVVTNPLFTETIYAGDDFSSKSDEDLSDISALSQPEFYGETFVQSTFPENDDTILYEESSSIIELKNASFAPSLMYGAALDQSQGSSSSSYTGSKNQNSKQSGSGYTKSMYMKDKDQYGSAGSGGQESNEDEEDDDNDDECKKHYIYADYWEDYDFDRISSQGFALISSQQVPQQCVCYLCGSAGEEKLIYCVLCCEPYHTFCLSDDDVPHEENIENWCCRRCQCCAVCGSKNNLLKCKKCQNAYHAECLAPHYPTKPSRKKRIWMCPKCVKCKSCGTTSPASGAGLIWNFDLLLCQSCAKLTDKGIECF